MSNVLSTVPTSRRGYLSQAELKQFADIVIDDTTEADDRISQAEELLDSYMGPQDQFLPKRFSDIEGLVSSINGSNQFTLELRHQNVFLDDYFKGCEVEIIGGTGSGQRVIISASTYAGLLTTLSSFSQSIDTTSFYRLYQLGKFPRKKDVFLDALHVVNRYYKNIPEEVKRATAAQVEYIINQGDAFFRTDDIFKNQERIGDYEYQKSRSGAGATIDQLIAPKAKWFLRGFQNRKGQILV